MLKLNKKGFTVVELVIVIAVVAILAAVLIPTFINLMQTANESADIQLVTNLNKIMAMQEALGGKNGIILRPAHGVVSGACFHIEMISGAALCRENTKAAM